MLYYMLFSAEIWGTVSDWVMVAVTAITALFLYRTLKSQIEVQQVQNELFKIESIRFKESIKPILKYKVNNEHAKTSDEKKRILTIEVTNENNSMALEISRFVAEGKHTKQLVGGGGSFLSHKKNHLTKGDDPLLFHFGIDSDSRDIGFITILMKYQDVAGTKYNQRVLCVSDEFGTDIHANLPEVVE